MTKEAVEAKGPFCYCGIPGEPCAGWLTDGICNRIRAKFESEESAMTKPPESIPEACMEEARKLVGVMTPDLRTLVEWKIRECDEERAERDRLREENERLRARIEKWEDSDIILRAEIARKDAALREVQEIWSFDEYQGHTHSWHTKQDWIEKHRAAFAPPNASERVPRRVAIRKGWHGEGVAGTLLAVVESGDMEWGVVEWDCDDVEEDPDLFKMHGLENCEPSASEEGGE